MSTDSPTKLTLAELRDRGWTHDIAEHWNAHARRRVDLFGFCDVIAIDEPAGQIVFIQTTDLHNAEARRRKITGEKADVTKAILRIGQRIEVWAWEYVKPTGKNKPIWKLHVSRITPDDFKPTRQTPRKRKPRQRAS